MTRGKITVESNASKPTPVNGNIPEKPGREPVRCDKLPCAPPCSMGAHGFICHFTDGGCLRHPQRIKEGEHTND